MALLTRLRTARTALGLGRGVRPEPVRRGGEVPESVAIIMDGNGRWARERHLPVGAGHRAGARALKRVVRAACDAGIKDLTVFSFSTENWSRPEDEVGDLMGLFCELIDREVPELNEERVNIRFIGRCDELGSELRAKIAQAEGGAQARQDPALRIVRREGQPHDQQRAEVSRPSQRSGRRREAVELVQPQHGDQGGREREERPAQRHRRDGQGDAGDRHEHAAREGPGRHRPPNRRCRLA